MKLAKNQTGIKKFSFRADCVIESVITTSITKFPSSMYILKIVQHIIRTLLFPVLFISSVDSRRHTREPCRSANLKKREEKSKVALSKS